LSTFESKGELFTCKKCGKTVKYNADKTFTAVGEPAEKFPFTYVNDWYEYQSNFVRNLDIAPFENVPTYTDEQVEIFNVQPYKRKILLQKSASISIYADKFVLFNGTAKNKECGEKETVLPFEKVTAISVLGKNKLNVYFGERVYQVRGDERFNALKYVQLYHHSKNVKEGDPHGEFLGL
jgi:hypothetical protein